MALGYPDLKPLYRFPFGVADNPNVVIEPTTQCNVQCSHCYRGSNDRRRPREVMSLDEVKAYIDSALALRRFHTLSFLGGEPLLYPHLDEAIAYAVARCPSVGLYTNGALLSEARARRLAQLGVDFIYVHVDRHQGRGETEDEAMRLRARFCDLFRALPDVNFGLGVTFHQEDVNSIASLARFVQGNADVIRFFGISLLGPSVTVGTRFAKIVADGETVDAFQRSMCHELRSAFGFEYGCYLGSKYRPDTPGKLVAISAYRGGEIQGSACGAEVRAALEVYHRAHGRYPYLLSRAGAAVLRACERFGEDAQWQTVAVSMSPLCLAEGVVNICDSCTDSVLFEGHFVPMCVLEPIKRRNPLVLASVRSW